MATYPIPPWITPEAGQGYGNLFATGIRLGEQARAESDNVAQEAQNLAFRRDQLQQSAVEANMAHQTRLQQFEAQQEAQRQDALLAQTKLDVSKAYQDAQIGIQKSKLDAQIGAVANRAMTQQAFAQDVSRLIAAGKSPSEAYEAAILKHGPNLFSGTAGGGEAFARAIKPPEESNLSTKLQPILNPDGTVNPHYGMAQTGGTSQRPIALDPMEHSTEVDRRMRDNQQRREAQQIRMNELRSLAKEREIIAVAIDRAKKGLYSDAVKKIAAKKPLDESEQQAVDSFKESANRLKEIDAKIESIKASASVTPTAGNHLKWDPKSGLVPVAAGDQPDDTPDGEEEE